MSAKKYNILVIEDDIVDFMNIEKVLSSNDIELIHCFEGKTAMNYFNEKYIDCVILDYLLPDINGDQLIDQINRMNSIVPIVVVTGNGNENIAVKMMKLGATDYITKNNIENLPNLVNQYIKQSHDIKKKMSDLENATSKLNQYNITNDN